MSAAGRRPPGPADPEDEDRFAELLARFDEALASGVAAPGPPASDHGLGPRLARAQALLAKIEGAWPRAEPTLPAEPPEARLWPFLPGGDPGQPLQLGRFRILRKLGRGGGGVVFLAIDPTLGRQVALKVPNPDALIAPERRRRFLREGHLAAGLEHPNLVPVFEAGEIGPVCYIASAFCDGISLAERLRDHGDLTPPRLAAAWVEALARGIHHAHERGVLHRDIKPTNVLITRSTDRLSGRETLVPRLIDFGLAIRLDAGDETPQGTILGTPAYMAPEQARGRKADLGPPADVYGLGGVLYELLVGGPPFRGESDVETLRHALTRDPTPPHLLRPGVPRDLEAVCLKCLEKDPAGRYPTAEALALDLQRFLGGEPTHARPIGRAKRAARWVRRHPSPAVALALAVALAATVGGGLALNEAQLRRKNDELSRALAWQRRSTEEARRQHALAEDRGWLSQRHLYAGTLRLAQEEWEAGNADRAQDLLLDLVPAPGEADHRGFGWFYSWRLYRRDLRILRGGDGPFHRLVPAADGRRVATLGTRGTTSVWDLEAGRLLASFRDEAAEIHAVAIAPDGRALVTAGANADAPATLTLRDAATGRAERTFDGSPRTIDALFVSPDGRTVLAAGRDGARGVVRAWDLETGQPGPAGDHGLASITAVARSRDGRRIGLGDVEGRVRVLDAEGRGPGPFAAHEGAVTALDLGVDGAILATGGADGSVRVWGAGGGERIADLRVREGAVGALAIAPDGESLACDGPEGEVTIREIPSGRPRAVLPGHSPGPIRLALADDGLALATADRDGTTRRWDMASGRILRTYHAPSHVVHALAFRPGTNGLAIASEDPSLRLWSPVDRPDSEVFVRHEPEAWAVAFAPDGRALATGGDDDAVRLWDREGRPVATLAGHEATVSALAFAPGGGRLASAGLDGLARLWDLPSGRPIAPLRGHGDRVRAVAFAPDGRSVATAGSDRTVRLWDANTGRPLRALIGHTDTVRALAFAPDGRSLVSAGNDGTIRVWDPATGRETGRRAVGPQVWSLAFAPDGRTLASGDELGTIRLDDAASGRTRAEIKAHHGGIHALVFTVDGRAVASGGEDRRITLWESAGGQLLLKLDGHDATVRSIAFAPDGTAMASADHEGVVRLWVAPPAGPDLAPASPGTAPEGAPARSH